MREPERSDGSTAATLERPIVRFEAGAPASARDRLAVEEPLEVRVQGEPIAVTMRTPGNDQELAVGFLFGEGLVSGRTDIGKIAHCGRPGDAGYGHTIDVTAAPGTTFDPDRFSLARRATITSASCGVCGRKSIDDLVLRSSPIEDDARFSAAVLARLPETLRMAQEAFTATGGLHAAGVARSNGCFLVVREDVGRHNAVDKVIGRLLVDGRLPARSLALVVSGRTSFEIVQKAAVAGFPLVLSVSAPSSLAVETAERARITLVGFARGGAFNVYAGGERVEY